MDMKDLTDAEVFEHWAATLRELRRRGLIRAGSNPVGDYAELLVAQRLGLKLVPPSRGGVDAIDDNGARYQVKARRLVGGPGDRELGVIKNIDQRDFDYLVVVLFNEDLGVAGMWRLPFDLVHEKAVYKKQVGGHVLIARDSVFRDPRAVQLHGSTGAMPPTDGEVGLRPPGDHSPRPPIDPTPRPPSPTGSDGRSDLHRRAVEKAAERLRLHLATDFADGYDAVDDTGTRYLLKARTAGSARDDELGAIKNIDQRRFDHLVFVLFDRERDACQMWRMPYDLVREKAVFEIHKNGHVLYVRPSVLSDARTEQLQ